MEEPVGCGHRLKLRRVPQFAFGGEKDSARAAAVIVARYQQEAMYVAPPQFAQDIPRFFPGRMRRIWKWNKPLRREALMLDELHREVAFVDAIHARRTADQHLRNVSGFGQMRGLLDPAALRIAGQHHGDIGLGRRIGMD